ncbi:unnamed protein product [Cuscuta epithymum]|uniref:Uncharacterized protein n=1 Tax=Cuscuta epithymum TaxID=186058 RepID=A0AAV0G7L1_9ASTE|nr:unnamed protein product [Cuscuta epithymum]
MMIVDLSGQNFGVFMWCVLTVLSDYIGVWQQYCVCSNCIKNTLFVCIVKGSFKLGKFSQTKIIPHFISYRLWLFFPSNSIQIDKEKEYLRRVTYSSLNCSLLSLCNFNEICFTF